MNHREILLKLLLTMSILATAVAALIAWDNPCSGFEVSIYQATPVSFWVLFVFSICSSFILLLAAIFDKTSPKFLRQLTFFLIFLNGFILTSLYVIRGYYLFDVMGDAGSHIGWCYNLLESGLTSSQYPGIYFQSVSLNLLTGVELETLMNLNSIFYYTVLLLGIFLLARKVCEKKREYYIIFFLASFYLFGSAKYMASSTIGMYVLYLMALFLFPLFASVVFTVVSGKRKIIPFFILAILLAMSISVHHLLIGVFAVLFVFCVLLQEIFVWFLSKRKSSHLLCHAGSLKIVALVSGLFSAVSVLWVFWIGVVGRLQTPISAIKDLLGLDISGSTVTPSVPPFVDDPSTVTPSITPIIDSSSSVLSERGSSWADALNTLLAQSPIEIFDYVFKYVGLLLIFLAIIVLVAPYIIRNVVKNGSYKNFTALYLFVPVCGVLALLPLLNVTSGYESGRPMFCVVLVGILCTGVFLNWLYQKSLSVQSPLKSWKKVGVTIFILLIIVTLVYLGVISCYHSVDTRQTSCQTTLGHVSGMDYYLKYADLNAEVKQVGFFTPSRFVTAIYHSHTMENPLSVKTFRTIEYVDSLEDHFGYDDGQSHLVEVVENTQYVAVTGRNVFTQNYMVEKYNRPDTQTEVDWNHFGFDNSVNKLYHNIEFDFYSLRPATR